MVLSQLIVSGLRCEYGGVAVVQDVSFECGGDITGLIGPNGAGKSTVLGAISGYLSPVAGRVVLDSKDVAGLAAHKIARMGIARTFQLPAIFARMSVLENLLIGAPEGWRRMSLKSAILGHRDWRNWEEENIARAHSLLADFTMEPMMGRFAGELSGGQRRLVEIMRSLMGRPKILLLDEPMAGVSPMLSDEIADHLMELARGGLGMLLIEHELRFVDRLCEHVIVLANGRVLMEGSMSDARLSKEVVEAYIG